MIPDLTTLIDALLVLLLPGFIALKIWERFFPRTPSQKQDNFDKVATYFLFTLIIYIISYPLVSLIPIDPTHKIYFTALLSTIVSFVLSSLIGVLTIKYRHTKFINKITQEIDNMLPSKIPIWHKAFHTDRLAREFNKGDKFVVKVGVFMKDGTIYSGEISSYPIEDNKVDNKDFMLKGVTFFKKDGKKVNYPSDFILLLNQRDVEAILCQYVSKDRIKKKEKVI